MFIHTYIHTWSGQGGPRQGVRGTMPLHAHQRILLMHDKRITETAIFKKKTNVCTKARRRLRRGIKGVKPLAPFSHPAFVALQKGGIIKIVLITDPRLRGDDKIF